MRWATSVRTAPALSVTHDFKALGVNLAQCRACRGHSFALLCVGDAVSRFLAPRLITTAVVVLAVWATVLAFA